MAHQVTGLLALLAEIDALRATLSTDLALTAAALTRGADDLAVELVTRDLLAVSGFHAVGLAHLSGRERGLRPDAPGPA